MEKYCELFDSLPKSSLEVLFGENTGTFLKLKVLKQSLKAKIKVNRRSISKLESEEVDLTASHLFSNSYSANIPPSMSSSSFSSIPTQTIPKSNAVQDFGADDFDEFDMMVSRTGDMEMDSFAVETGPSQRTSQQSEKSNNSVMGNFYSGTKNDGLTGEFDGFNFPHSELMQTSLRYTFGLKSFRPNQLQAINATMLGRDCFVLMPTGGGKSLCYQLPATLTESVTIIISPLKSLILDQVNKLQALDIVARNLSGEQSMQDVNTIYRELETTPPTIKVLYVTPEKISASARLQDLMKRLFNRGHISRFVIDEAHCVR